MRNILALAVALILASCSSNKKATLNVLTPAAYKNAIEQNNNIQIIDVRTPEEFESGSIKNAVNINIYEADFIDRINSLDKSKPTYVYCKVGARSSDAANALLNSKFKKVYQLEGGLLAWSRENFPLQYSARKVVNPITNKFEPNNLTQVQFDSLSAAHPVSIIDFTAVWCGPCKRLSPILEELQNEYGSKIAVQKIDIDKNKDITNSFMIMSIPFLKFYKNGQLFEQIEGLPSKQEIKKIVDKMLK